MNATTPTDPVLRTRDTQRAHDVARRLAGLTGHAFAVKRFDARTLEVRPVSNTLPQKNVNQFRKLAEAMVALETGNGKK